MKVDWKTFAEKEIDTLKADKKAYLHAICCFRKWDLLFEEFGDDASRGFVLSVLRTKKATRTILNGLTSERIIELLDKSADEIRRRLLKILLMRCDNLETACSVGKAVLSQIKDHPWAYRFLPLIYSLQPLDDLRKALTGRVKRKILDKGLNPEVWDMLLDPENHFSKKDFTKVKLTAVRLSSFAHVKLLMYRKSLCHLVVDLACEALSSFKEKTKGYKNFVLAPAMENLKQLDAILKKSQEMRTKVKEAILASNAPLLHKAYSRLLRVQATHPEPAKAAAIGPFPIGFFLSGKIISPEDVLERLLPKVFEPEMEKKPDHPKVLETLCKEQVVINSSPVMTLLKQLSIQKPEHPLAKVWPFILKRVTELIQEDVIDGGREGLFQGFVNTNQLRALQFDVSRLISYDELMEVVTNVINHVIGKKAEILKESPDKYTRALSIMIEALTDRAMDFNIYATLDRCLFFHIPLELRDKLVMEAMADPLGTKLLNNNLSKQPTIFPLGIALLIGDLGRMTAAISRTKAKSCDEFGFEDNVSYSFPPFVTQEDRSTEECKGTLHIFERIVFQSLRHKNTSVVQRTFPVYKAFVFKILAYAVKVGNQDLYKKAAGCHWRFCRYTLSRLSSRAQGEVLRLFVESVCHPLAIYVNVKAGNDISEVIGKQLLARAPYTHPRCPFMLGSILECILNSGYLESTPGIENENAKLADLVAVRLATEFSPDFRFTRYTRHTAVHPESCYERIVEILKRAHNEVANIKWPAGYLTKISKRMFVKGLEPLKGEFPSPEAFTPEVDKAFQYVRLAACPGAVLAIARFLKQKIDQYVPQHYTHPSTQFLRLMIERLKQVFSQEPVLQYDQDIPMGYELHHTMNEYNQFIAQLQIPQFSLRRETVALVPSLCPGNAFYSRLLAPSMGDPVETFVLLDAVCPFRPLSVEEAKAQKGKPKPKLEFVVPVNIGYMTNLSNLIRIRSIHEKPKPKRYNKFGQKLPERPIRVKSFSYEPLLKPMFAEQLACFTKAKAAAICEHMKLEGPSLSHVVLCLHRLLHCDCETDDLLEHIVSILELLIRDLLIKNPKPTAENPKPKETPTLFCDEEGVVRGDVPPIGGRRYRRSTQSFDGAPKFRNTKALLAYVAHMLRKVAKWGHIDTSKYTNRIATSVKPLLETHQSELKKILGDTNENHWADYFVEGLLCLVDFGDTQKDLKWAQTSEYTIYSMLFDLLSCDQFHYIALSVMEQNILKMTTFTQRYALLSGLIAGVSSLKNPFSLQTRNNVATWCMDPRIVGYPLPQFCIDYVLRLSQDKKLHIDTKRAIASGAVAYLKNQAVRKMEPMQIDAIFELLTNLHKAAKAAMTPTFCQLIRPKLCRQLAAASPLYRDLMPRLSEPRHLIAPQAFGEVVFPRRGVWAPLYEKFLASFLGSSLLSSDEHAVQLVIQVLTKIGVRGGEVSQHMAPFVAKACNEFNVLLPSAILLNFVFRFCAISDHQVYQDMINGFVEMFQKLRGQLDIVAQKQLKPMWLREDNYDPASYEPLNNALGIFIKCTEDVANKSKEKDDITVFHNLCKKTLVVLNAERPPVVQLELFESLRRRIQILANDNFADALVAEVGEPAMEKLLKFIVDFAGESDMWDYPVPDFVDAVFRKNDKFLTKKLVLSFANWPVSLANKRFVHDLLREPIHHFLDSIRKEPETVSEVLPLLSKFTIVGGPVCMPVGVAKCAGFGGPPPCPAPCAPQMAMCARSAVAPPMKMKCAAPMMRKLQEDCRADVMIEECAECDSALPECVMDSLVCNQLTAQMAVPRVSAAMGGAGAMAYGSVDGSVDDYDDSCEYSDDVVEMGIEEADLGDPDVIDGGDAPDSASASHSSDEEPSLDQVD